jgi:hypothetical protein
MSNTISAPKAQEDFCNAQLELLAIRASELADRVSAGQIGFLDAIDMAHSAAEWSGLTERVGDDQIQKLLAASFARCGEVRQ